jgi:thioredoxin-like negative regulator of GroEL
MAGLTLAMLVQSSLFAAGPDGYAAAYRQTQANDQPLLVLVGADWCPGCRTMKYSVLPRLHETGTLREVNLAVVNVDEEDVLAGQLMRGGTIPQLIVYSRTANGWHREQITGATSEAAVEGLLLRAREARQASGSVAGRSANSASGGN